MDCGRWKGAANRGKNSRKAIIGTLIAGRLIRVAFSTVYATNIHSLKVVLGFRSDSFFIATDRVQTCWLKWLWSNIDHTHQPTLTNGRYISIYLQGLVLFNGISRPINLFLFNSLETRLLHGLELGQDGVLGTRLLLVLTLLAALPAELCPTAGCDVNYSLQGADGFSHGPHMTFNKL